MNRAAQRRSPVVWWLWRKEAVPTNVIANREISLYGAAAIESGPSSAYTVVVIRCCDVLFLNADYYYRSRVVCCGKDVVSKSEARW